MGGLTKEVGEPSYRVFDDAAGNAGLDKAGYTLQISATEELTKGAAGAAVYGVAYMNTKNPLYMGDTTLFTEYLVDPELAVIHEGTVDVQVEGNAVRSTAIHVGDIVAQGPTTAGKIAHIEDNTAQGTASGTFNHANHMAMMSEVVGISEEQLAATADPADGSGCISVRLMIFGDET